jgi:hypothetical protein
MSNELSKRQIRAKIYYLKKTGQTNKYKRYLKQYRDYTSEDEEEQPEEKTIKPAKPDSKKEIIAGKYYSVEPEEDENENNFLLSNNEYNKILDKIKNNNNSLEVDFLQSFFNQANEKGINTLWKFFRDRQKIINEEI